MPPGSPGWSAAYKNRWASFLKVFEGRRVVVFLGAPSKRLPHLNAVNAAIAEAAMESGASIAQISPQIQRSADGVHYLRYRDVGAASEEIASALESLEVP